MEEKNELGAAEEPLQTLGRMVAQFLNDNRLSTEWVRSESHFGNSKFTQLKRVS